jgi:hypothetical protein
VTFARLYKLNLDFSNRFAYSHDFRMALLIHSFLLRESLAHHYGLSNTCDDVSPKNAIVRKYIEPDPFSSQSTLAISSLLA